MSKIAKIFIRRIEIEIEKFIKIKEWSKNVKIQ